jgi:hypothetical protein
MTTATIWDEKTQSERSLTEAEIRRMQDIVTEDYRPVDEDGNPVEKAYDADEVTEAFKTEVNRYINLRNQIDPKFNAYDTSYEYADFDFYGDEISIEWREHDHCGDYDYFRRTFPLAHLWAPSWEDVIKAEVDARDEAEKAKQAAFRASQVAAFEAFERKRLSELLAKYGVPESYRARPSHG